MHQLLVRSRPDDASSNLETVTVVSLVEDDDRIRLALRDALVHHGYGVVSSSSGLDGLRQIIETRPDVVVLDLGLPDIDGLDLLKMMRAVTKVPVIVATANDDEGTIIRTLDAGVDDYVVKPFSSEHLEARLRAVLRRSIAEEAMAPLRIGRLEIDPSGRTVSLNGDSIELTRKEFDLLCYLAAHAGSVVTKRELMSAVWDLPFGGGDKTLDVHISWLRKKLGESATSPRYLHVLRGAGVKLVDPDE